jgi:hypothetical protein
MLERAALALARSRGRLIGSLDELDEQSRANLIEDARAVILEMRSPSLTALMAGRRKRMIDGRADDIWRAMIDAVLSEESDASAN